MNKPLLRSESAFASERNFGVRGYRAVGSSPLDKAVPQDASKAIPSAAAAAPQELTEAEEEAVLTKRFATWTELRVQQTIVMDRQLGWKDATKFLLAVWVLQQFVHRLGFKFRFVGPVLALLGMGKVLWQNRAPAKRYPEQPGSDYYTNWPIVGQIGFVGDLLELGVSQLQLKLGEVRKYNTSEWVVFGKTNEYSIMDPNDRRYMLRTNWKNFIKNLPDGTGILDKFGEVMGRGFFAVDGEEWADQRKVASHMFSANGLRLKMERSFTAHGLKAVQLLKQGQHFNQELDFQDVMANLTFETICDIAFGLSPGCLEAGLNNGTKDEFLLQFDRAQQNSTMRFTMPDPVWKLLRYLNVGTERQLREDGKNLRKYVREIVRNHQDGDDNMLSLYIRTGKQTGKKFMLEEDYLIDTILNFMIAGRDTTSSMLTNMIKLMTPEVERKMLDEFRRVVGQDGNVSWDHVRDLQYCSAVFNEVLRMYPPVPFDLKSVLEDDVFPSGLQVKAGDSVSFAVSAIGRDPNLFDHPNEFIPERWIVDPNKPVNRPDEYVFPVFWGGPRLCLGKDMAKLESLNVLYILLRNFTFEILPHSEKVVTGPVQFYVDGLPVKIHLRKD